MKRLFLPATCPEDWQHHLGDPEKHWKAGYSAWALAHAWHDAEARGGFPPEIEHLFTQSPDARFRDIRLLLALPEFEAPVPGKGKPSQSDLFVLAKDAYGDLAAICVEGKVQETFGKSLRQWLSEHPSPNRLNRLAGIQRLLGLDGELPGSIYYQLLHRAASAVILAREFNACSAAMVIHSFSQHDAWFEHYQEFVSLFGIADCGKPLVRLTQTGGVELYSGWATGEAVYVTR